MLREGICGQRLKVPTWTPTGGTALPSLVSAD